VIISQGEPIPECVASLFSHSGYFYSAFSSPLLLISAPNAAQIEFHAEAPQATASEGLAQGSYLAARA